MKENKTTSTFGYTQDSNPGLTSGKNCVLPIQPPSPLPNMFAVCFLHLIVASRNEARVTDKAAFSDALGVTTGCLDCGYSLTLTTGEHIKKQHCHMLLLIDFIQLFSLKQSKSDNPAVSPASWSEC